MARTHNLQRSREHADHYTTNMLGFIDKLGSCVVSYAIDHYCLCQVIIKISRPNNIYFLFIERQKRAITLSLVNAMLNHAV